MGSVTSGPNASASHVRPAFSWYPSEPRSAVVISPEQTPDIMQQRRDNQRVRRALQRRQLRRLLRVLTLRHQLAEIRFRAALFEQLQNPINEIHVRKRSSAHDRERARPQAREKRWSRQAQRRAAPTWAPDLRAARCGRGSSAHRKIPSGQSARRQAAS